MGVRIVERKTGYKGCDRCPDFDSKVIPTVAGSYKLCGFCYRHAGWVTLLNDPGLPILKCEGNEGNNDHRINKE